MSDEIVATIDIEAVLDPDVPSDGKKIRSRLFQYGGDNPVYDLIDANPFPPPPCWRVVTIGMALFIKRRAEKLKVVGSFDREVSEEEQLRAFVGYIEQYRPTLVTWNGRGFDLPVIMARAMKYGIQAPWWFSDRDTRYRYSLKGHYDLMDAMSDFGASPRVHLEQVARLVGLPGKPKGADGSKVSEMLTQPDGHKLVKSYCLSDVFQTAVIWLRYDCLRGVITKKEHDKALDSLRTLTQTCEPMPPGYLLSVEWERLFLDKKEEIEVLA